MSYAELFALIPLLVLAGTSIVVLLVLACFRNHLLTTWLSLTGLSATLITLGSLPQSGSVQVTSLLVFDGPAKFFAGLIVAAGAAVILLGHGYLADWPDEREEFCVLVLLTTLGAAVLTASAHFASFFLGLELLSVSLYALIAYPRWRERSLEAGVKYLVLAGVSSAILLFGMALVYMVAGTMTFANLGANAPAAGLALIAVGIGFKLALVPFHLWTPDVYQGAPAPVTALVATVSKGAVLALLFRLGAQWSGVLIYGLAGIAIVSMIGGTLLALLQENLKRLLAYSSIAHLGFLLVAFLAKGKAALALYLVAYFVTIIGAFGVVAVLAQRGEELETVSDYRGLFWKRPWLAGTLTAMMLSLAGLPLTAGFVGKFGVVRAGVDAEMWTLVLVLVATSAVGLYYYLRVLVALYAREDRALSMTPVRFGGSAALTVAVVVLLWLGVYPAPMMQLIQAMIGRW